MGSCYGVTEQSSQRVPVRTNLSSSDCSPWCQSHQNPNPSRAASGQGLVLVRAECLHGEPEQLLSCAQGPAELALPRAPAGTTGWVGFVLVTVGRAVLSHLCDLFNFHSKSNSSTAPISPQCHFVLQTPLCRCVCLENELNVALLNMAVGLFLPPARSEPS